MAMGAHTEVIFAGLALMNAVGGAVADAALETKIEEAIDAMWVAAEALQVKGTLDYTEVKALVAYARWQLQGIEGAETARDLLGAIVGSFHPQKD